MTRNEAICAMVNEGQSYREIGRRFGISWFRVGTIARNGGATPRNTFMNAHPLTTIDLARHLWDQGLTAWQIAHILTARTPRKMTSNAVYRIAYRHGFTPRRRKAA